jgi:hypothetical protein
MRRIKVVLALSALMVAMLVATAGPAMADHTNRHERLEDRRGDCDWLDCRDDRRGDCDWLECRNDNAHDVDLDFDEAFLFVPFLIIEEIDIDCDGEDDDWDGWIDEGADCEVEIEFFEWWD